MCEASAPVVGVWTFRLRFGRLGMLMRAVMFMRLVVGKAGRMLMPFARPMAVLSKCIMKSDVRQWKDIEPRDPQRHGKKCPCAGLGSKRKPHLGGKLQNRRLERQPIRSFAKARKIGRKSRCGTGPGPTRGGYSSFFDLKGVYTKLKRVVVSVL